MYNALVMPYFNYCGAVWGNINMGLADKLQKPSCRIGLLEFSPFLTMTFAQVFWLGELGWERLEYVRLNSWL